MQNQLYLFLVTPLRPSPPPYVPLPPLAEGCEMTNAEITRHSNLDGSCMCAKQLLYSVYINTSTHYMKRNIIH
jgi:hypothetical protein